MSFDTGNTIEVEFRRPLVSIAKVAPRPGLVLAPEHLINKALPLPVDAVATEPATASPHPLLDQWRRKRPEPG